MKMLPKYVIVHGVVAPRALVPFINKLAAGGVHFNSVYRGDDASALLAKLGLHSQKWLYEHQGRPEQPNPANPPGFSTHELRNDGVAYSQWKRGARIPWWACGMDVNDADVLKAIHLATREGWKLARTYPSSNREYHHLNFRKPPLLKRVVHHALGVAHALTK